MSEPTASEHRRAARPEEHKRSVFVGWQVHNERGGERE